MDPILQKELQDLSVVIAAISYWRSEDYKDKSIVYILRDYQVELMVKTVNNRLQELYHIRDNSTPIFEERRLDENL